MTKEVLMKNRWLIVPWREAVAVGDGGFVTINGAVLVCGVEALKKYAKEARGLEVGSVEEIIFNLETGGFQVLPIH